MKRIALVAVVIALTMLTAMSASAGDKHDYPTTTTLYEEDTTTTVAEEETTTTVVVVEETTTTVAEEETTTTTEPAPVGVCVDPNAAGVGELMTVQGITHSFAITIIELTTFGQPFASIAELQETIGIGNQVLEPVFPDWPGYFSDECLSEGFVQPTTTTTEPEVEATVTTVAPNDPPEELPFTGTRTENLLMAGSGLVALGALALWSARRREDAA